MLISGRPSARSAFSTMHALAGHLLKRGFEAHRASSEQKFKIDLPVWGWIMLGGTVVLFFATMFMVQYTLGRLVPTLLMIESEPESITFEPIPTEDPDSTIKDPEPTTAKPQPITASFRKTLKLLQSKGGLRSRFRGLSIFIVNAVLVQMISGTLSVFPIINLLPRGVTAIVAYVLCANLALTWTHIAISEPSPKVWFRRLAPLRLWKKIAGPTALFALAEQLSVVVPIYLAAALGLTEHDPNEVPHLPAGEQKMIVLKGLAVSVVALILSFLVVIPATVTLTRVQASLLDDSEETIVPFDRSFGGKVIPEIVGGNGIIGMLDAWKSFDWASRIRLLKAYLKVLAIEIAVWVLFIAVFVCQIFIIVGKNPSKAFVPIHEEN